MKVYTVTSYEENDCYKRPETWQEVLGTYKNKKEAIKKLAETYREQYEGNFLYEEGEWYGVQARVDAGTEWTTLLCGNTTPTFEQVADFFSRHASGVWAPEYIKKPTFRVEITESEVS